MILKKLVKKLNSSDKSLSPKGFSNPIDSGLTDREQNFINHLSNSALKLYERERDIKKFTDLALSAPIGIKENKLIDMLFESGIVDPLDDKSIMELASNKKLWKDLDLD